jgi:hypothetical protein
MPWGITNFKFDYFDIFNNFAYFFDSFDNLNNFGGQWGEGMDQEPQGHKF